MIEKISEKKTSNKGKPYWTINASGGTYGVWKAELREKLQEGNSYKCDIVENDKYKVINNIFEEVKTETTTPKINGNGSMYVSYCKDLVIAGKTIDEAITIIKKAIEAFK